MDIPPLRERGDDALLLARYYIEKVNQKRPTHTLRDLSPEVQKLFRSYDWPGNVRELKNVIERASILEDGKLVTATHLPADMLGDAGTVVGGSSALSLPAGGVSLEMVEFELAKQAFDREGGNLTRAARLLGISRDQLRYKLRKGGFEPHGTETK